MSKKKNAPPKLLNDVEVLARLFSDTSRPSTRTFIRWREQGKIPFVRIGRKIWFQEDKVRAALERKNHVRSL